MPDTVMVTTLRPAYRDRDGNPARRPPVRLHQPRWTAGEPIPVDAIYVGPGSPWANPFRGRRWTSFTTIDDHGVETETRLRPGNRVAAVALYRQLLAGDLPTTLGAMLRDRIGELAGRDLVCRCRPGRPCHADVLLQLANATGGRA